MKIVLPEINTVFDCADAEKVNCVVIENQNLFIKILTDLENQLNGDDGKAVLSNEAIIIGIDKNLELHSSFVPFDINQKTLINKVISGIQKLAVDEKNYVKTMELLGEIERYLLNISMDLSGDLDFTKVTADNLIKSSGVEFSNDYDHLSEKLLDYFELVTYYDRPKLFVLVNLRSFISDEEMILFLENVLQREYQLLMVESSEHILLEKENRVIIDSNLCEIC